MSPPNEIALRDPEETAKLASSFHQVFTSEDGARILEYLERFGYLSRNMSPDDPTALAKAVGRHEVVEEIRSKMRLHEQVASGKIKLKEETDGSIG